MSVAKYFEDNRYVYLSSVLSKDNCEELTNYMFDMYDKGLLEKDPQCPLSDSIYGSDIFDGILDKLAKPLSQQLGVELLPAYTYARIYRPGDELVKHKDRESCEISGTMTLGFDPGSGLWPIFFGKEQEDNVGTPFEIGVGDLVMYRGNELYHWRPKYKGVWQVQVFFHYVDANGPHKDFAYDGRKKLGTTKEDPINNETPQPQPKAKQEVALEPTTFDTTLSSQIVSNMYGIHTDDGNLPCFVNISDIFYPELAFTEKECDDIITLGQKLYPVVASVGSDGNQVVDKKIRSVDLYPLEMSDQTEWIFKKIGIAVGTANAEHYGYHLTGITHSLQLLHYKATDNGHYDWHVDVGPESSSTRKISVSIPLSKPTDYEGGELHVNDHGVTKTATKQRGSIAMFPSYQLHQVAPVTKGERWALVIWINGPRFR